MNKFTILLLALLLFFACKDPANTSNNHTASTTSKFTEKYPITEKTLVKDNFFGKEVEDPFRWLEDENSSDTKQWVGEQNEVSHHYLSRIPFRASIKERLTQLWNYEKYSTPFKENGKYYFFKNDGLQNQSVLYVQDNLDAEAKVVLDPNKFSNDGTSSLAGMSFSKDGKYLAYGISEGGSDWRTAYILDLETGKNLNDKIEWIKFSGFSWYNDGFYYSRFPSPKDGDKLSGKNEFHQVFYHKIGDNQSQDALVYADRSQPDISFYSATTEDESFHILYSSETTSGNALYFRKSENIDDEFTPLVTDFEHDYSVIDNIGEKLLVITNYKAPNQRLLLIDTRKPEQSRWKEIIPETENVLNDVSLIGNKIIAKYIRNANSQIKIFSIDGEFESELALPENIGTVGAINGKRNDKEAFYSFRSFVRPSTVYKLDVINKESEVFKEPQLDFNSDEYETKQVWYESYDGQRIPMFITHKKGIELNGANPTLLYGYGGFNINILPGFKLSQALFLENNGIYAVPNIRGGGEFGKKWHKAGTKLQKQNVFNDFMAAAEYLIDNNYTSSEKLAISGRSNGGLLVGACMTQKPELFAVALPAVGVMDMLRYHKFTIGRAWATDYGTSEDSIQFKNLLSYSPVHNVKKGTVYPATLVTTGDHDDRVVPAHSYKFISALQEVQPTENNPVLIRIDTNAGHGSGKPTSMLIEELTDILSFVFYNLDEEPIY